MISRSNLFIGKDISAENKGFSYLLRSFFFNILSFLLVFSVFLAISWWRHEARMPLATIYNQNIKLDIISLFHYSSRTVIRIFFAIIISFLFALCYAPLAAKSKKMEAILIPLLDVLQSVPILGYISFTVTAFISISPNNLIGIELASIFAIFTSQVWNIIFSLYHSMKSLPEELHEASKILKMTGWQKFWRIELPFSIPNLVLNIVVSISSSWFFIVASEAISVGKVSIMLPGIGSYIFLALQQANINAIYYALIALSFLIILYDRIFLKPLLIWSSKFHYENVSSRKGELPKSFIISLFIQSSLVKLFKKFIIDKLIYYFIYLPQIISYLLFKSKNQNKIIIKQNHYNFILNYCWYFFLSLLFIGLLYYIKKCFSIFQLNEIFEVIFLTFLTCLRVFALIALAIIIWVPIGIYIGSKPVFAANIQPIVQILAAFPINLLFPATVFVIKYYELDPNIWLSFLMIMGAQWYILFNVIAGALSLPNDLKEVVNNLKIKKSLLLTKVMLPVIMPNLITGAVAASGGAWNASIIAELVHYGKHQLIAKGIGSYIALASQHGDLTRVALGVGFMAVFVVLINRFFWQPINDIVVKKYKLL